MLSVRDALGASVWGLARGSIRVMTESRRVLRIIRSGKFETFQGSPVGGACILEHFAEETMKKSMMFMAAVVCTAAVAAFTTPATACDGDKAAKSCGTNATAVANVKKGDCASKCSGAKATAVANKKSDCASKCSGAKATAVANKKSDCASKCSGTKAAAAGLVANTKKGDCGQACPVATLTAKSDCAVVKSLVAALGSMQGQDYTTAQRHVQNALLVAARYDEKGRWREARQPPREQHQG